MLSGIIFDIKRFAVHDGPGIRTTVFFKGCPLRCPWCHNPEGIQPFPESVQNVRVMDGRKYLQEEIIGRKVTSSVLLDEIEKDRLIMEESGGGVTFSGGEPLFQPGFLVEMLTVCNDRGIHTAIDTSGSAPAAVFKKIVPLARLLLFDLKTLKPELSLSEVGAPLEQIVSNFNLAIDAGARLRVRIPVIPGFNFDEENLALYLDFIAKYKNGMEGIHLLPFHATAHHKYSKVRKTDSFSGKASLKAQAVSGWISQFSKLGIPVKPEG
ncbi:MAG: radical SAM protein [Sedimentisphaerales bacterium]|nr:radical SAM protein [Sedimentisphaerales bacterium]